MDILYIYKRSAAGGNDTELRCSLRSIARHGSGIGRIFIVGDCPDWLSDEVVRIPYTDAPAKGMTGKNNNILRAIIYALDHSDIGEEFLTSTDDHFYMQDVDFAHYPFYCKTAYSPDGELPKERGDEGSYKSYLYDTRLFLERHGLPTKCLTLHRDLHCSRRWIRDCKALIDEVLDGALPVEHWVLLLNWALSQGEFEPVMVPDCKIWDRSEWGHAQIGEVFSTADFRPGGWMHRNLLKIYGDKCKYER